MNVYDLFYFSRAFLRYTLYSSISTSIFGYWILWHLSSVCNGGGMIFSQAWYTHLDISHGILWVFLSYPPVHDRAGPWNTAMNAACVLHNTTAVLHRSCDFYCYQLFLRPSVSFGTINVIVTSWFLPQYAQRYRST